MTKSRQFIILCNVCRHTFCYCKVAEWSPHWALCTYNRPDEILENFLLTRLKAMHAFIRASPLGALWHIKAILLTTLIWVISLVQPFKQANRPTEVWTEVLHCYTTYKIRPGYQRPIYSLSPNSIVAALCLFLFLMKFMRIFGKYVTKTNIKEKKNIWVKAKINKTRLSSNVAATIRNDCIGKQVSSTVHIQSLDC